MIQWLKKPKKTWSPRVRIGHQPNNYVFINKFRITITQGVPPPASDTAEI